MKKAIFSLALLFSIPHHLCAMEEGQKPLGNYSCNSVPANYTIDFFKDGMDERVYSDTAENHAIKASQLDAFTKELWASKNLLPKALSVFKAILNEKASSISDEEVQDKLAKKLDDLTEKLEIINVGVRHGELFAQAHPDRTDKVSLQNYEALIKACQNDTDTAEELLEYQIAYTLFRKASNAKQIEQIKTKLASLHQNP